MTAPAYVDFANDKLRVHPDLDRHRQLVHTKGANPAKGIRDRRDTSPIAPMRPSREALLELRAEAVDGFFFHDGTSPLAWWP